MPHPVARQVSFTRYPLLKFLIPLAVVVLGVGLVLFLQADDPKDPGILLPWIVAAAAVAFASLLWKRKEQVTVLLPSDRLQEASRTDLEGILETLEQKRDKGELTPERYTKARNKVLAEMEAGAKRAK